MRWVQVCSAFRQGMLTRWCDAPDSAPERTPRALPLQVPELEPGWTIKPDFAPFLDKVSRAQATIGKAAAVPMVIGPVSFICLSKVLDGSSVAQCVAKVLPAYRDLLRHLKAVGVSVHTYITLRLHQPNLECVRMEGTSNRWLMMRHNEHVCFCSTSYTRVHALYMCTSIPMIRLVAMSQTG